MPEVTTPSTPTTTPASPATTPTVTPSGPETKGIAGTTTAPAAPEVTKSLSPTSGSEEPTYKLDLTKIPKELHEVVTKEAERINNEIRSNYTKKHQEIAAERRKMEETNLRLSAIEKQHQETLRVAKEVLADPTNAKLHEYRQKLGYSVNTPANPTAEFSLPENPTVGDLINVMQQMVDAKINGVKSYADTRTNEGITEYQRSLRWEGAVSELEKDPVGKLYTEEISYAAMNTDKYRSMYDGQNEKAVLMKVLDDFKAKRNQDLDQERQAWLSSLEKKKEDTTLQPTVQSGGLAPAKDAPKTREQIVREMAERFGLHV